MPGEKLVRRLEPWRFVRLVLDDNGSAVGVLAQDRRTLTLKAFPADGIVLCTGDYAGLFAEAASHAVGANGLLARVGAYYHDIGKLVKPQYFIENQPRGRNPHDKLRPSMSAAIIRNHVVAGHPGERDRRRRAAPWSAAGSRSAGV